jgi:hypothetical protein
MNQTDTRRKPAACNAVPLVLDAYARLRTSGTYPLTHVQPPTYSPCPSR